MKAGVGACGHVLGARERTRPRQCAAPPLQTSHSSPPPCPASSSVGAVRPACSNLSEPSSSRSVRSWNDSSGSCDVSVVLT